MYQVFACMCVRDICVYVSMCVRYVCFVYSCELVCTCVLGIFMRGNVNVCISVCYVYLCVLICVCVC